MVPLDPEIADFLRYEARIGEAFLEAPGPLCAAPVEYVRELFARRARAEWQAEVSAERLTVDGPVPFIDIGGPRAARPGEQPTLFAWAIGYAA